jgi:hypothetical protein
MSHVNRFWWNLVSQLTLWKAFVTQNIRQKFQWLPILQGPVADLRILGLWRLGPEGPLKLAARSVKFSGFEPGETLVSMQPAAAIFASVLRVAYLFYIYLFSAFMLI